MVSLHQRTIDRQGEDSVRDSETMELMRELVAQQQRLVAVLGKQALCLEAMVMKLGFAPYFAVAMVLSRIVQQQENAARESDAEGQHASSNAGGEQGQ